MKKKIKYTDEPMQFQVVDDFLPAPEDLIAQEDNIKVTLTLSRDSVAFFKQWALRRKNAHYQTMIRRILDHYVAYYSSRSHKNSDPYAMIEKGQRKAAKK
jgi:hypothetical protein